MGFRAIGVMVALIGCACSLSTPASDLGVSATEQPAASVAAVDPSPAFSEPDPADDDSLGQRAIRAWDLQPLAFDDLNSFRQARARFFRFSSFSPIHDAQGEASIDFVYFVGDSRFQFVVSPHNNTLSIGEIFEYIEGTDIIVIEHWATVSLSLGDAQFDVGVFRRQYDGTLFVPFIDGTAVSDTYPGGRLVEVFVLSSGDLLIDFNYAANPPCAYSNAFICPAVPELNRLEVKIRAGERWVMSEDY